MNAPLTLAIATATTQIGVAVGRAGGPVASIHVQHGRRHAELLAPGIETVTCLAGVALDDVERVAVDTGPGLFTGLRVGVATAKALASALGVPVTACSSLELLAHPHRAGAGAVVSVVDARRGEVFWAVYEPAGDSVRAVGEPRVTPPGELGAALALARRPLTVTGDGARRYAAQLEIIDGVTIAGPEHDHPSAVVLVELSAVRAAIFPEKITPDYMRGADVRIGWERRDG